MTRHAHIAGAAVAAALAAACASMTDGEADTVDLLANGLDGWDRVGDANWTFADGVAEATEGSTVSFLVTPDDYRDFELTLEFYVSEEHNSGVLFRCADRTNLTDMNCYEANIFDDRPDQSGRTGGIPNYAPPGATIDAGGHWNTYRIRAEGEHIVLELNGEITVDATDSTLASGPLGLQWGAGTVRFRNVRVRRL